MFPQVVPADGTFQTPLPVSFHVVVGFQLISAESAALFLPLPVLPPLVQEDLLHMAPVDYRSRASVQMASSSTFLAVMLSLRFHLQACLQALCPARPSVPFRI